MDQEGITRVRSWLAAKGIDTACPACNNFPRSVEIGDVIAAPIISWNNVNLAGPTVAMVPVTCNNCGFVRMFSAGMIGLLQ